MAAGGQMQSDLVRPSRDRLDDQSGPVTQWLVHVPVGLGGPAVVMVDPVSRRMVGVAADRQVNAAGSGCRNAPDDALVDLVDLPLFELATQVPLGISVAGQQHQPRGVAVESVHDPGIRKDSLHAAGEAVLQVRAATRDSEQA